jgi:hypothetical protein
MDARTRGELVNALRRKWAALLKEFLDAEADLRWIAEEREAELEERVQGECAAASFLAWTIAACGRCRRSTPPCSG